MKTLLVLAQDSALASALRAALPRESYRIVAQTEAWEAEPLLRQGTIDACILDADLTDVRPIRAIEQIRQARPGCPVIVYAVDTRWEWEDRKSTRLNSSHGYIS